MRITIYLLLILITITSNTSIALEGLKGIYDHKSLKKLYGGIDSDLERPLVTKQQKEFFEAYMSTGTHIFRGINTYLRNNRDEKFDHALSYTGQDFSYEFVIDEMLGVFDTYAGNIPSDIILFRGIDFSYRNNIYPKVGEYLQDPAFISTSIYPLKALNFGGNWWNGVEVSQALLVIFNDLHANIEGLYIRSEFDSDETAEGEVLLRPGTNFKVLKTNIVVTKHNQKLNIILVRYCGADKRRCLQRTSKFT